MRTRLLFSIFALAVLSTPAHAADKKDVVEKTIADVVFVCEMHLRLQAANCLEDLGFIRVQWRQAERTKRSMSEHDTLFVALDKEDSYQHELRATLDWTVQWKTRYTRVLVHPQ